MTTQIDDIIIVNEQEIIQTSVDGYFKGMAIVAKFENATLNTGKTFSVSGHEEYTSLDGLKEKFPTTHPVYKLAKNIFTQKINTGVNKSGVEVLSVCQILSTDDNVEAGLTRIGYADAYHWVYCGKEDADIESFNDYFADKRKLPHAQTDSTDILTDEDDNIAQKLANKSAKIALYYHATNLATDESVAGALAAIDCSIVTGKNSGVYQKPTGITADSLTQPQQTKLDLNNVNYYTFYLGQAGKFQTRKMSAGGFLSNGQEIQKQIILDRLIINLQSAGMDALEMQLPYDDRGGAVLEGKLKAVLKQLQNEGLIAADSLADDGTLEKGQTLRVLPRATVKREYASLFAQKCFVAQATAEIALTGKKVQINLAYAA